MEGEEGEGQYYDREHDAARRDDREREGFSDHERWSEEADDVNRRKVGMVEAESERRADAARSGQDGKGKERAKKAVAVVVSADTNMDGKMDEEDVVYTEHAVSTPSAHNENHAMLI